MAILFQCGGCGRTYTAAEHDAGGHVQCVGCGTWLVIPSPIAPPVASGGATATIPAPSQPPAAPVPVPPPPPAPHGHPGETPVFPSAPSAAPTGASVTSRVRRRSRQHSSRWLNATIAAACLVGVVGVPVVLVSLGGSDSASKDTAREASPSRDTVAASASRPNVPRTTSPASHPVVSRAPTVDADGRLATAERAPPADRPVTDEPTNGPVTYASTVRPFLAKHCFACHGPDKKESMLRLDTLAAEITTTESLDAWQEVVDRLIVGEMPPPKATQPTQEQRQSVIDWLDTRLRVAERAAASSGGQVVLRRLNRAEYANTIRDLVGIEIDPAAGGFPEDARALGFDNIGKELVVSPALMQKYLDAAKWITGKAISPGGRRTAAHRRIFGAESGSKDLEAARKILRTFASRAFRRPVEPAKLDRLVGLVEGKLDRDASFEEAVTVAIQAILCSPQFIYMVEDEGELDDYELATRLSYFLWSSMPDTELFQAAQQGTLRKPGALRDQARRMLADPKSEALVANFVGQWLGARDVGVMQPDEALFPDYDADLETAIRGETEFFFAEILRENLSALNFIDSEFTMLNERLARHYGIRGVRGSEFRRVALRPEQHRGGVLGQASVLSITSDGVRSSPVVRGVWVLTNLLGTPPSPPPDNVPDLEPDTRGTKTIRDELARHRTIASCNSCHRRIDPLGFALENYDAVGRWRTHYPSAMGGQGRGIPVDTRSELSDGQAIDGVADLKRMLLDEKRQFSRCLTEKLLTYAIGRGPERADRETIDGLVERLEQNDHKLADLVVDVTESRPFRTK